MKNLSDTQLIQAHLDGDDQALSLLIFRYIDQIYAFVFRYVKDTHAADDVTQEVFIRAWKSFGKFEQNKNFKAWLYTIAKNAALDFLRKRKVLSFSAVDENKIYDVEDVAPLPPELLKQADQSKTVAAALKKLPAGYSEIVLLYYKNGFNLREIAEILGKPLNTVKSDYRRALAMLKKIMHQKVSSNRT